MNPSVTISDNSSFLNKTTPEIVGSLDPIYSTIILALFFSITIFFILPYLSKEISLLGMYHSKSCEKLKDRRGKVRYPYLSISFTLIITYWVIFSSIGVRIDICVGFLILAISLITSFVTRVYGNPAKNCAIDIKNAYPKEHHEDITEQHRERILSFIFSLISAQIIVALLFLAKMLYTNTLPSFEIDPYTLVFYFVLFAVIYGIAICALSYFGESYMEYHDPVNVADTRSKSQKRLAARNAPNRGK